MTVYFQHVGEHGGKRDFPKTIGTKSAGLRHWVFPRIEDQLDNLSDYEKDDLREELGKSAPEGFQIWGIPSGARAVMRDLRKDD